ncbi:response regulator [Clostridium boliviensis]|uniref:Stage 0 sporulation protein A homolog n=1 Tax=Clostridium boliviensis TaxID=318465 RepID=A0ABU4GQV5_9CLOT|nr:response regulator [Clostridium boliviensis]MDW2800019.1 response regulator [Clostridium boliviensis]
MYQLLVVEDEVSSRNILATCFPWNELGFELCGQADNGKEALEIIESKIVHVVFTDISMPVMDGIELTETISHLKGSKPLVVFLSAHDDFKYAQEAIKYGVRYYALKPSSFGELKEIFGRIREELDEKYQTDSSFSGDHSDKTMKKVLEYCAKNYRDGSLSDLSQSLYLNPSYLSQLIKQKTNMTFSDHIQEIRMKQAAVFLQDASVKIYHISSMVGYVNSNNFTRAFRTYYGMTPTEYRSKMESNR